MLSQHTVISYLFLSRDAYKFNVVPELSLNLD